MDGHRDHQAAHAPRQEPRMGLAASHRPANRRRRRRHPSMANSSGEGKEMRAIKIKKVHPLSLSPVSQARQREARRRNCSSLLGLTTFSYSVCMYIHTYILSGKICATHGNQLTRPVQCLGAQAELLSNAEQPICEARTGSGVLRTLYADVGKQVPTYMTSTGQIQDRYIA